MDILTGITVGTIIIITFLCLILANKDEDKGENK